MFYNSPSFGSQKTKVTCEIFSVKKLILNSVSASITATFGRSVCFRSFVLLQEKNSQIMRNNFIFLRLKFISHFSFQGIIILLCFFYFNSLKVCISLFHYFIQVTFCQIILNLVSFMISDVYNAVQS